MEEINVPTLESIEIPDKAHFKIGEVAKLLDLEPYVLRYWEKEFDVLEPSKTDSGQRAYQRDDIELLATIRELLYTEMFTIDGARRQLERARAGEPSYLTAEPGPAEPAAGADPEVVEELEWENEQLRREIEETQEARLELEAEIESLEAELEEARSSVAEDSDEIAQLRGNLAEAKAEIEELRRERDELREETADSEIVDALRGEVSELDRLAESVRLPSGS